MKIKYGFTLIELIMAIIIIAVAVTGTLLAFSTATSISADPMLSQQSISIAKSYLSEILTKDFPTGSCSGSPSGSRADWDNVCDYNGLSDVGAKDQNSNAISGLGNYTVSVAHPNMQTIKMSAYKANYES